MEGILAAPAARRGASVAAASPPPATAGMPRAEPRGEPQPIVQPARREDHLVGAAPEGWRKPRLWMIAGALAFIALAVAVYLETRATPSTGPARAVTGDTARPREEGGTTPVGPQSPPQSVSPTAAAGTPNRGQKENPFSSAGTLSVRTFPPGASISINGRNLYEVTPAWIMLPAGTYNVTVEKNGRQNTQSVEVRDKHIDMLSIHLE